MTFEYQIRRMKILTILLLLYLMLIGVVRAQQTPQESRSVPVSSPVVESQESDNQNRRQHPRHVKRNPQHMEKCCVRKSEAKPRRKN
jgi:hypothetical protein